MNAPRDITAKDASEGMQSCRSLAEILGSEVHRANRNGAWMFPGGDILLFVPEVATREHLEAAREFMENLILAHDSDRG